MAIFGRSTGFVRNKMAGAKDSLILASNDFKGGFSAFLSSDAVYRRVRASARSYYLREMLDSKLSKKNFRILHRSAKRLEFYGSSDFQELFKDIFTRYSDNPAKLQRKSEKIFVKVLFELDAFISAYEQMLIIVKDELLKSKQMLLLQDELISSLFTRIRHEMESSRVYISEEILDEARDAFIRALSRQQKEERSDVMEDSSLEQANYVKKSILARLMGTGYVIHKVRKSIKKWYASSQGLFRDSLDKVETQLDNHQLSPITFSLLVKYAKDLPSNDDFLKEITHDAKLCLASCKKQLDSVLTSMAVFLSMFKGIPDVNKVLVRLSKLHSIEAQAQQEVRSDKNDAMRLSDKIEQLHSQLKIHFADLKMASRRVLSEVRSNPVLALQGMH